MVKVDFQYKRGNGWCTSLSLTLAGEFTSPYSFKNSLLTKLKVETQLSGLCRIKGFNFFHKIIWKNNSFIEKIPGAKVNGFAKCHCSFMFCLPYYMKFSRHVNFAMLRFTYFFERRWHIKSASSSLLFYMNYPLRHEKSWILILQSPDPSFASLSFPSSMFILIHFLVAFCKLNRLWRLFEQKMVS